MSVTNPVDLNGGLDSQQTQSPSTTGIGNTSLHPLTSALVTANSASALPQDTFIPASQTELVASSAQAAGLFNGPKTSALPSTSVGAQGVTNSTAEISAPSNSSANSQAGSNNSSASGGSDATAQTVSASANASTSSSASASGTSDSSSTAAGSVAQQTQLNTLNNALARLGLSAADIQQIDRVARLTNDYSPTAFTSLAYQLEAQAQNAAASSAPAQNTQTPAAGEAAGGASSTSSVPPQSSSSGQGVSLHSTEQPAQTETPAAGAAAHATPRSSAASA